MVGDGRTMGGSRRAAESARAEAGHALVEGRRKASGGGPPGGAGPHALLALQRRAGNAAVNALMAARMRWPGEQAVSDIDGALKELRRDEPAIDTVETGLKAAKAAGIPVELEGPKPPASALAVTKTGFGPESVPAKKAVPPAKPVPAVQPAGEGGGETGRRARSRHRRAARRSAARHRRGRRRAGRGGAPLRSPRTNCSSRPCRRPAPGRRRTRRSRTSPGRSRASPRTSAHTHRLRRRPRRRRTPQFPRPMTSPARPRRPRSTRWTPSRPDPSTRRRSSPP